MSRAQEASDAAAAWIIRREHADWNDADQTMLDAWLTEADGNKAAYWRLRHSWREADRIGSLGVRPDERLQRHRPWWPAALAASLALAIGLGTVGLAWRSHDRPTPLARYDTPLGARRSVALADGSRVELNTKTAVRAAVSRSRREVWLDDGEAFFEIARDPAHPFVVHAGAKTVTVLGTRFSVRREAGKVTVAVLHGRVRVDDAQEPGAAPASSATLTDGAFAISQGSSMLVTQRSEQKVEKRLAWRDGILAFDETPLEDAAAEFNRYNSLKIIVADRQAASIRVGGSFRASNVEAFSRLLRDAYGLKISRDGDTVKISS